MYLSQYTHQHVVIIGLGKTGRSCVQFLSEQGFTQLSLMDDRKLVPDLAQWIGEYAQWPCYHEYMLDVLNTADLIIVSPGVDCRHPYITAQIEKGVPCIGDVELFAVHAKAPIVAITGSNGKTTVATMISDIAKQAGKDVITCGNIGLPVLDALALPQPDFFVLELSSFQLETTASLKARVAVVLNVSPDHLDRHASFVSYVKAKLKIYDHAQTCIVNEDESELNAALSSGPSVGFSLESNAEFCVQEIEGAPYLVAGSEPIMSVGDLPSSGYHHVQNALACLAMGRVMGLSDQAIVSGLKNFTGLPHRCRQVAVQDGVMWYNDSKATNVGATIAAIQSVGLQCTGSLSLILGGEGKGADFTLLRPCVRQQVSRVIVFGKDAAELYHVLNDIVSIVQVETLQEAVELADIEAKQGDTVLFSPACASFDMFNNYMHRGDVFERLVLER